MYDQPCRTPISRLLLFLRRALFLRQLQHLSPIDPATVLTTLIFSSQSSAWSYFSLPSLANFAKEKFLRIRRALPLFCR